MGKYLCSFFYGLRFGEMVYSKPVKHQKRYISIAGTSAGVPFWKHDMPVICHTKQTVIAYYHSVLTKGILRYAALYGVIQLLRYNKMPQIWIPLPPYSHLFQFW